MKLAAQTRVWQWTALALAASAMLTGCGMDSVPVGRTSPVVPVVPPATTYSGAAFRGNVMAGSQPIVGASVQLYAAGTTGNGAAGSALLTVPLVTDSTGAFTVPAGYGCPLASSVLYAVAAGGTVKGAASANAATVLMTSPGACSSVTTGSSFVVNEATTVGSAFALAQFLKAGAALGSSATNVGGLTLAAGTLANLVNLSTGAMPGAAFPATASASLSKLGTLANAVNACVVAGSAAAACSQLFSAATPAGAAMPATTLDAIVSVAQHPALGTSGIYAVSAGSHAYAELAAAPADWAMFVTYKGGGMNQPTAASIDSTGRVWVANYKGVASLFTNVGAPVFGTGLTGNGLGDSYGGAVDANDRMWVANEPEAMYGSTSSVSLFSAAGAAAAGPYTSGGLYYPVAVAHDTAGVAWVVNYGNSRVILLDGGGNVLSGAAGYDGVDASGKANYFFPLAVAVDSKRNGWIANGASNTVTKTSADGTSYTSYACCYGASAVAIDTADNVWVANYFGDSVGLVSAGGAILSGTGYTAASLQHPQGIAVDGMGNVWVASRHGPGLTELAGVGSSQGPGALLSPSAGWASEAAPVEAYGLAVDASGNVWVTGFGSNTLTEYVGIAAPVKTPLIGPVRVP